MKRIATAALAGFALLAFAAAAGAEQTDSITKTRSAGKLATKTEVIAERGEAAMVTKGSVRATELAIALYENIAAAGGWQALPVKTLKPGDAGEAVLALRTRLTTEGYLRGDQSDVGAPENFDEAMEAAVRLFQSSHGLAATGKIDAATIRELNVPVETRLQTLRINAPRLADYMEGLGDRYILVNITSAQLEAVNGGVVFSRHNVVVGKLKRPTPVVKSRITQINFNPFWNAPVSIVRKDLIPKLIDDPLAMDKMRIRIFDGYDGPEIDPTTVDWSVAPPERYFFRQDPGGDNAMATVKINFHSKHNVYLHDTPAKALFLQNARFESSGCVRVEQVHTLVDWVLNGQDGMDQDLIGEIAESVERKDVAVRNAPDIRIMYLTGWATEDGHVNFRPDIYNLDAKGFVEGQPETEDQRAADADEPVTDTISQ